MHEPKVAVLAPIVPLTVLEAGEPGLSAATQCLAIQSELGTWDARGRAQLHPDAWSWYTATLGEQTVGHILAALGPEWRVWHSVPMGSVERDIDHLLVGPSGVYTLASKSHRGAIVHVGHTRVFVNGHRQTHLLDASDDAARVTQRLLDKTGEFHRVTPLVVITGADRLTDARAEGDRQPQVIQARQLLTWLRDQPRTESQHELELVAMIAEEADTWAERAAGVDVMARFEQLRADVGDAPAKPASGVPSPVDRRRATRTSAAPRPMRLGVFFGVALVAGALLWPQSPTMVAEAITGFSELVGLAVLAQ